MLDLMRDILLTARLDDRQRFTQMVAETKAGMESGEQCYRTLGNRQQTLRQAPCSGYVAELHKLASAPWLQCSWTALATAPDGHLRHT